MNNSIYTQKNINEALDFAYGMGLKLEKEEPVSENAMDFAYAMGLKQPEVKDAKKAPARRHFSLRFGFAR